MGPPCIVSVFCRILSNHHPLEWLLHHGLSEGPKVLSKLERESLVSFLFLFQFQWTKYSLFCFSLNSSAELRTPFLPMLLGKTVTILRLSWVFSFPHVSLHQYMLTSPSHYIMNNPPLSSTWHLLANAFRSLQDMDSILRQAIMGCFFCGWGKEVVGSSVAIWNNNVWRKSNTS